MKNNGFAIPSFKDLLDDPKAWLDADLTDTKTGAGDIETQTLQSLVEDAYLRTLSRFPEQEEIKTSVEFIEGSETIASGMQSLLWALVNTKEFIISH